MEPFKSIIKQSNLPEKLKGRLQQFDNTLKGKSGHGGAERVRFKYKNYDEFVRSTYVSVNFFECMPASNECDDLLIMGTVAKFEYECLAKYVGILKQLPEFNNKNKSQKK